MFWLISRLQAPEEELCQVSTKERQRYSPIPLSLPTGNFLNPLPLRVRAKTLVSSRGGGRSAMATSEHSTAPRSSPAGQHGYTGVGASQYGRLSQVQVSPAKKSGDKRMERRGRGGGETLHFYPHSHERQMCTQISCDPRNVQCGVSPFNSYLCHCSCTARLKLKIAFDKRVGFGSL